MSRFKKTVAALIGILLLTVLVAPFVSADVPYETYTYLEDRERINIPHAYVPGTVIELSNVGVGELEAPGDLFVDQQGNIYISDTGNNRILCLDSEYRLKRTIDQYIWNGEEKNFNAPDGLWVTDQGVIYVADTGNGLVVALNQDNKAVRVLGKPETELISKELVYQPEAVATDRFGRVFVVAKGINLGMIVFSPEDDFQGFLGAQKVTYNALDLFWRRYMSEEQKDRMTSFVPTEYNNLTVDSEGFVYAVSAGFEAVDIDEMIMTKDTSGRVAPIRKLNQSGFDVLKRAGYYPPAGDLVYEETDDGTPVVSALIDITLGPAGTYTVLDLQRGRLFTYAQNGELLFAFGTKSSQIGNSQNPCALSYQGNSILVLDSISSNITVYMPTEYGNMMLDIQEYHNNFEYDKVAQLWEKVIERNPNYDAAYDGVGTALVKQGKYQEAMEYFEYSGNIKLYSEAFREYRDAGIKKMFFQVLIIVVLLIAGIWLVAGYVGRCNQKLPEDQKHPNWYRFLYAFYIMTHPFDGMWDLKHEKRGGALPATIILGLVFITDILQRICTARIFNNSFAQELDPIQMLLNTVGVALLFVVANWCLTSLMDGKANIKDIYISTCYALMPMFLFKIATIPLSYLLTLQEEMFLSLLNGLAMVWGLGLIFIGIMVTQQYSLVKNTVTCVFSIVGMGIILFVLLLYLTAFAQIFEFLQVLFFEMFTR